MSTVTAIKMRLNEPSVAIRLYAFALTFIGTANLAMLLGPAIVINLIMGMGEGLDPSRSRESLDMYVQQLVDLYGLETGMVLYLLSVSFLISCIYIIIGVLMFFRRPWVRKLLLFSFSTVVLVFIANLLIVGSITGRYLPTFYSVVTCLVIPIAFLGRFTRADARQLFADTGSYRHQVGASPGVLS
jgi:hypothetical protein